MIIRFKVRCLRWTTSLRSTQRWCGSSTRPRRRWSFSWHLLMIRMGLSYYNTRISGRYLPKFQLIRRGFGHIGLCPQYCSFQRTTKFLHQTKNVLQKITVKTDFGETKHSIKKLSKKKCCSKKMSVNKIVGKKKNIQQFFWPTFYFSQNLFLLVKQIVGRP